MGNTMNFANQELGYDKQFVVIVIKGSRMEYSEILKLGESNFTYQEKIRHNMRITFATIEREPFVVIDFPFVVKLKMNSGQIELYNNL